MSVFSFLFGRRRSTPVRVIGPSDEDVDVRPLGLNPRASFEVEKNELEAGMVRPAAAIPLTDDEQDRVFESGTAVPDSEKEMLLSDLNEVGYNLKRMLGVIVEMQGVVAHDFDSLTVDEKLEARSFIDSLRAIVVNEEQSARQAA